MAQGQTPGPAEQKRARIIAAQAEREEAEKAAQRANPKPEGSRPSRRSWAGPPAGFRSSLSRKRNEP
jgi:hypothetical protein